MLLFIFCCPLQSFALTGKVISVADGDTITILDSSKQQHKIRLYGIDTPEKKQACGMAAKQYTSRLAYKKVADVNVIDTDRYGRSVGVVTVDGVNVNESILNAGYAWQYGKYCKKQFCGAWLKYQNKAKAAKKGLWRDKQPTAPWDWRKAKRNTSYKKKSSQKYSATSGEFHGNVKSHVFHRASCRHYNCKNCTQGFSSRSEALNAGYKPCGGCKP